MHIFVPAEHRRVFCSCRVCDYRLIWRTSNQVVLLVFVFVGLLLSDVHSESVEMQWSLGMTAGSDGVQTEIKHKLVLMITQLCSQSLSLIMFDYSVLFFLKHTCRKEEVMQLCEKNSHIFAGWTEIKRVSSS